MLRGSDCRATRVRMQSSVDMMAWPMPRLLDSKNRDSSMRQAAVPDPIRISSQG
mgnify:CR=1 FL=1